MHRSHRDPSLSPPMSASGRHPGTESDLFSMLLPNDHTHIPKGKAAMWDRHYQQQHQKQLPPQRTPATTPTRPQSSQRFSLTSPPASSPRQLLTSPEKKLSSATRCKSADMFNSPRRVKLAEARQSLVPRAATESRLEVETNQYMTVGNDCAAHSSNQLPLNVNAREHMEMKACMLAHMHRIDVDALQRLRETTTNELEAIKARQILARGGILDDGSLLQSTKRKTSFLLRHFFALGETVTTTAPTKQDTVLYDVIDEWSCHENASPDEIAALWKSIIAHIESSYVLRRQLVPSSDPNPLSITIAMDCLRKLPAKLPDYRRMLDVIISLVESGLYLPTDQSGDERDEASHARTASAGRMKFAQRRYYFDECQMLREALDHEMDEKRARLAAEVEVNAARRKTPREQLHTLLDDLRSTTVSGSTSAERDDLFRAFFHADIQHLMPVALQEVLRVCYDSETSSEEHRRFFLNAWMPLLQPDDATEVLVQLTTYHIAACQTFFHEEIDAMDKLLMAPIAPPTPTPSATSSARRSSTMTSSPPGTTRRDSRVRQTAAYASDTPAMSLFHALIERHPAEFAAVLWSSPFLTAHVFQDSQHLIARILEQNIVSVSHVLHQRPDVLSTLLNHALKDNSVALEEFLQTHPKAFSDLLINKGPSVTAAIKSYPSILVDILQSSRPTLAKALLAMPELLCHLLKSTPELLAQTVREDQTILPLAFSVVPQCLSDALERHPEYLVDVAHRKPALVVKIFSKYPDLLLEPLEANPSVFSNFLVFHRKILPDFSNPNFDPSFFQFERKQFTDSSQQTEKQLCKFDGRLRIRERMKFQEDSQVHEIRQALAAITATISANGRLTPASANGRTTPAFSAAVKEGKGANGGLLPPSPGQVVSEITRIYMKKHDADAQTDALGKKRQALVDFVLDLYIQELGFKSKAQKKLTLLLTGAKQAEQESLRIKWFLRFMNASGISAITLSMSATDAVEVVWTYHPLASEFYRAATEFLVALPNDELSKHLEQELSRPCLIGYTRVKQFLEDPLMMRMLPGKDQRQQILTAICEKEYHIHGSTSDNTTATKTSSAGAVTTLHLEDVLESLMAVWIQFQDSIRNDWTVQFQLVNPDGSGVLRYTVFVDLIRAKMPAMNERAIMKIYHQCGEENDLGEYFVAVDDFSLAMSIIHEQDAIRQYAARIASKTASSP